MGDNKHDDFDPSAAPPFNMADLRSAVPKRCWLKNTRKSLSYFLRDCAAIISFMASAAYLNHCLLWPFYWLAQGTLFWSLFVLGHDCGHGSFSDHPQLNNLVGHLAHSFLLVPYHGWRISHRLHHQNHGHVDNDESWHPVPEKLFRELNTVKKFFRFSPLALAFAYPIYLWISSPGKSGSHFHPGSPLFKPSERRMVLTSTMCCVAMLCLLAWLSIVVGPMWMVKLYFIPYMINVTWLAAVTYLHHHGYKQKIPWYRGKEWSYIRGGLSTIDRDYGFLNKVIHDINIHVVHHLFPQIPHYHLIQATEAIKPTLGKYYRKPEKSGLLPLHLVKQIFISMSEDHYVDNMGDVVFYSSNKNNRRD